jgi:ribokinase
VTVVGSAVVDFVAHVPVRPRPGETVLARDLTVAVGGKGCNQAIAAARLGAEVAFVGCVGDDPLGGMIRQALARDGVDARHLYTTSKEGTAIGMPVVDDSGQNTIVMAPRANMRLTPDDVRAASTLIEQANALLLQGEIPMDASLAAARIAHGAGAIVILNAAPAGPFPPALLDLTDVLVVNEFEAATLTEDSAAAEAADWPALARKLLRLGPRAVIITLGDQGAYLNDGACEASLAAHAVKAVDPTGAGDAFCGAVAAELARGLPLTDAVRLANAAGALAVTITGAEPALPRRADVERLLTRTDRKETP